MKEDLRRYIIETYMSGEGELEYDQQLFETGILNSIGFLKLLGYIESNHGIALQIGDFTIDSGTIDGIVAVAQRKAAVG
jgi:acyl carrier protein